MFKILYTIYFFKLQLATLFALEYISLENKTFCISSSNYLTTFI